VTEEAEGQGSRGAEGKKEIPSATFLQAPLFIYGEDKIFVSRHVVQRNNFGSSFKKRGFIYGVSPLLLCPSLPLSPSHSFS